MSDEKKNYFVVNRELLNSDRWLSEKFTRGQAWIDLFGLAQHTKSYFLIRGVRINLERGQLGYSQLTLSKRWKWSRDKVRRYLKCLENDDDIRQQNNEVTTIITIVNYNRWQLNNTTNNTTEKQQKNIKQDTYKNDKNDKNDKNKEEYVANATFNQFWEKYPKKELKKKTIEIWRRKKLDTQLQVILDFINKAQKSDRWQKGYIKSPPTFLNGECWNDDLNSYSDTKKIISIKKYK